MTQVVPEGWTTAYIGSLCQLVNGKAFKPSDWSDRGLPIVRIQNLNNPSARFNRCHFDVEPKFHIRHGDLLFAWSGTPKTSFGAHIWTGSDALLNQHIYRVDFPEQLLDKRFLRLALNDRVSHLVSIAHGGVGLGHVTKPVLEQTEILVPPLAEQRRIVEKVGELLARVEVLRDRLAKVPNILRRFRQSVLAAACSGRLTEGWRASASAVEEWIETTLGGVLSEPLRNGHSARKSADGTGIRTLTLTAVTEHTFCLANTKLTVAEPARVADLWLEPGDILIERSNTPELVGTAALYEGPRGFAIYPDLLIRARVDTAVVLPQFAELCLQGPKARTYFTENAQGTAGSMPKIDQAVIERFPLALPSRAEQEEIIRRVHALFALATAVVERVSQSRARVDALADGILAKAFGGELVPTEAELARTEGRGYESAAELLERIRDRGGERSKRSGKRSAAAPALVAGLP